MTSLKEYAKAATARPRKCTICNLDPTLRAEVDAALREGFGPKIINNWLREEHNIAHAVQYHKVSGHHMENK